MGVIQDALERYCAELKRKIEMAMNVREPVTPSDLTGNDAVIWRRGMRDGMRQVREAVKEG